jgi:tRNA (guanosine-2'-O-)-methyltransferase
VADARREPAATAYRGRAGTGAVGHHPEAIELLDVAVEIPMIGTGASRNVAVAGSLVLYRLAGYL